MAMEIRTPARKSRPALLQPIRVGATTLPNRVIMGSMHTGLESHPERFAELGRFYADRARGGVALIVTGGFAPNHAGRLKDEPGTLERPDQVPPHRLITDAVHRGSAGSQGDPPPPQPPSVAALPSPRRARTGPGRRGSRQAAVRRRFRFGSPRPPPGRGRARRTSRALSVWLIVPT